ncbi:MAG: 2'-5' RNA ligase family protein [Candidatus Korobacteraceae bacterium]
MPPQYALVAYVRNSVGQFVEDLRSELCPDHGHSPAHISILPPRCLLGTEAEALEVVENVCRRVDPFEVVMGEVQTFMPVTPTVFIRVAHAAYRVRELHDLVNVGALRSEEPWPFMPHLTLFKMETLERARNAYGRAAELWERYSGSRRIVVDELTFVCSTDLNRWTDLAPIPLGNRLASIR